tara:strand:+ start:664 stop:1956 length:1293 start_codon:yes stop_codon:yes gene_type:complete
MKIPEGSFIKKSFAIYGLGKTGLSVKKYLKINKVERYFLWDDNKIKRKKNKISNKNIFLNQLSKVDYIILSPGIKIDNTIFKKELIKNKNKIITDLDLLYLRNKKIKSIVVTGTNGKSTTCKLINHILTKKGVPNVLGGNIGIPVLDINFSEKKIFIIEASSFQLEYSKFIKPTFALLLNISNDHLDWHKNLKNYKRSKFKIFKNQSVKDFSFLNDKELINIYQNKKYKAKLNLVKNLDFKTIRNIYLKSKANIENLNFVFCLSKKFKINKTEFLKYIESFKGLNHRYEIFLKLKNIYFINDSKATTFEASKYALMSEKNIYWILGGLPKLKDKFYLNKIKKNIIRAFIIGKKINYFKKQLTNKINFTVSNKLESAVLSIFKELRNKNTNNETKIVLFSPASASFDQFKNFEERGNNFKKITKTYARKYF